LQPTCRCAGLAPRIPLAVRTPFMTVGVPIAGSRVWTGAGGGGKTFLTRAFGATTSCGTFSGRVTGFETVVIAGAIGCGTFCIVGVVIVGTGFLFLV